MTEILAEKYILVGCFESRTDKLNLNRKYGPDDIKIDGFW